MNLHLTWSIEKAGRCLDCGEEPILIEPSLLWHECYADGYPEEMEPVEEITAHWCTSCGQMISLHVNA